MTVELLPNLRDPSTRCRVLQSSEDVKGLGTHLPVESRSLEALGRTKRGEKKREGRVRRTHPRPRKVTVGLLPNGETEVGTGVLGGRLVA